MSLWKIALRSIQQRGIASLLTMVSMALGVTMVVAILAIHGIVAESFSNSTQTGYQMIVAATKGGKLQVTLNTVFYLSSPVENIPYDYYLEFLPQQQRDREFEHSLQKELHDALWQPMELGAHLAHWPLDVSALAEAAEREWDYRPWIQPLINQKIAAWEKGRPTRYGRLVEFAIPVCLGDYVGSHRVVGTTPEFFAKLRYGSGEGNPYRFAAGRNFRRYTEEHGYFEAVVGAVAARRLGLAVGDTFSPSHGASDDKGGEAHHHQFTVVGVLAPTGTPNDRAVFINMEGFYLLDDHAKPLGDTSGLTPSRDAPSRHDRHAHEHDHHGHGHEPPRVLPVEQREVTAVLVRAINGPVTMGLQNKIDEEDAAQAVLPMLEIFRLFEVFVNPIKQLLVALTVMICVVSGISILVSIYNSMSERKREIAVMRALGAERTTVMAIILLESIMLALGGGMLGWFAGHSLIALAGGMVEQMTGVQVGFFSFAPGPRLLEFPWGGHNMVLRVSSEAIIIPGLIVLAVAVGIFPAWTAYRTDVARALSD